MSEEPAKLDETLDARPYEPPERRRSRWAVAAYALVGLVLVGVVTGMAIRHFGMAKRPTGKLSPNAPHEVKAFTSEKVRITVGMTKAEVRDVIAHGRQMQHKPYNFGPIDEAMHVCS